MSRMSSTVYLTEAGKKKIAAFVKELEAKRKEILDAGKDEPGDVEFPTEEDIIDNIEEFGSYDGYYNSWGCTANTDLPIALTFGLDYVYDEEKIRNTILSFDPSDSTNAIETYLEKYFQYSGLTRNILDYVKAQGFTDPEDAKLVLDRLLDGMGLTSGELSVMARLLTEEGGQL